MHVSRTRPDRLAGRTRLAIDGRKGRCDSRQSAQGRQVVRKSLADAVRAFIHKEVGVLRKPVRSWMYVVAAAAVAIAPVAATSGTVSQAATHVTHAVKHTAYSSKPMHINCAQAAALCTEVANSDKVFGHYVGHDEPSLAFYSHKAGSGNHMSYTVTLPKEPPASNPNNVNKAFSFELSGADWFGMAHVRHPVVPRADQDVPARQRQQHPQPGDQPPARGHGLHGDAVLPARLDPVADLAGGRGRQLLRPHPVVCRAEHRQPVAEPGDQPAEQPRLPGEGRRSSTSTSPSSPRTASPRARPTRSTRRWPRSRRAPRTCS